MEDFGKSDIYKMIFGEDYMHTDISQLRSGILKDTYTSVDFNMINNTPISTLLGLTADELIIVKSIKRAMLRKQEDLMSILSNIPEGELNTINSIMDKHTGQELLLDDLLINLDFADVKKSLDELFHRLVKIQIDNDMSLVTRVIDQFCIFKKFIIVTINRHFLNAIWE